MPLKSSSCFWAKLGSGNYPQDAHPVICHLLDVGNVATSLWSECLSDRTRERWARELSLSSEQAERWIAFWVGSHDIGKVCPGFQHQGGQLHDVQLALKKLGFGFTTSVPRPHGSVSTAVLSVALADAADWPAIDGQLAERVARCVGGHHGTFPNSECFDFAAGVLGGPEWRSARRELLAELAAAFQLSSTDVVPRMPHENANAFFYFLAGLTSVADWIGSNQSFFKPVGCNTNLEGYVEHSRYQAVLALKELGWLDWQPQRVDAASFRDLFPLIESPRPLQTLCVEEGSQLDGPGLVLVEAPMGEGKTEAALFLADHWTHACQQRGLYVALPTQATSNQMFGRVCRFLEQRYPGQTVNTHLLHGQAWLSDEFDVLRVRADEARAKFSVSDIRDESKARVVAQDWFAQNKKQGLLAPFAVGTIDQSLMGVLQTRHMFVRLFGLAGKTVILDEVHAYDAYMSQLLERLLEWLSALGCSVVLLSATLPRNRRQQLVKAYSGCDLPESEPEYPRLTVAMPGRRVVSRQIEITEDRRRTIDVSWHKVDSLVTELQALLGRGGCIAVICNTVGRAQQLYSMMRNVLTRSNVDLRLFHARFPFGQRQQIEREVLSLFGPPERGPRPPRPCLLIATQVIEQSLDLDFDLLVTEVAPVDLVLQRAGRLQRHARPTEQRPLGSPKLWITEPAVDDAGLPNFENSEYVYSRYVLLRSYLALRDRPELHLPNDIESLVESVYSDEPLLVTGEWHAAMQRSRQKHDENVRESEFYASQVRIPSPHCDDDILDAFSRDLAEDDPDAHPKLQALTRLAEPSVSVLLLFQNADGSEWFLDRARQQVVDRTHEPKLPAIKSLLKNVVTLSHRACVSYLKFGDGGLEMPVSWREHSLLKYHCLVLLDTAGVFRFPNYSLRWDDELGIVVERDQQSGVPS